MHNDRKIIGITMGDGAGVGPEVIIKSLSHAEVFKSIIPVVIGDYYVMKNAAEKFSHFPINLVRVTSIYDISYDQFAVNILDLDNIKNSSLTYGQISSETGKASVEYIIKAIELAISGDIHGIATAPISKAAIHKAGFNYDGHTEILAEKTGTKNYAMSFFAPQLNVILVTTHTALQKVPQLLNKSLIFDKIYLASNALQSLGIERPRIAVAGLNPHAGEGGIFGLEEEEHITPAIRMARNIGINAHGPYPADTLFTEKRLKEFDMFVCMYHDQGLIPVKMLAFDKAVNVTLGLPFIRTSVDHGTAFDIAGKGIASPFSMIEAIKLAARFERQGGG